MLLVVVFPHPKKVGSADFAQASIGLFACCIFQNDFIERRKDKQRGKVASNLNWLSQGTEMRQFNRTSLHLCQDLVSYSFVTVNDRFQAQNRRKSVDVELPFSPLT